MATITVKTNVEAFSQALSEELKGAFNPEFIIRPALLLQVVLMHSRIHVNGQASDGGQIGLYSKGYLAVRSGIFQNTPRFTRGVNKGKPNTKKSSGVFTSRAVSLNKETGIFNDRTGQARPRFHRGTDPKVIISLTRQLENDYAVVASENGRGYGISFHNQHNYDKSQFVEHTYNKPIFNMTDQEEKKVLTHIEELANQRLNG